MIPMIGGGLRDFYVSNVTVESELMFTMANDT